MPMTTSSRPVRPRFAVFTVLLLMAVLSGVYYRESVRVARFASGPATVADIVTAPRTRKAVLEIEIAGVRHKTVANLVLFSQIRRGQVVMVKWDPDNTADVVIDRFGYIHRTSLGMGIAVAVLVAVLTAVLIRASRQKETPAHKEPVPR